MRTCTYGFDWFRSGGFFIKRFLELNLDEFLARVEKDQGQVVFLAMSVPDYELMAYNTQELKRYIRELKEVVVYYKTVTTTEQGD